MHLIIITRFFVHGGVATEYKKMFVLNNASFMFIVCYIYAIVFKQLFLYLYPRLCNQKISTKRYLVPAIPFFEALNIPTTPSKIVNH